MNCDCSAFAKDPGAAAREADLYCVAILPNEHNLEHFRFWSRGLSSITKIRPEATAWTPIDGEVNEHGYPKYAQVSEQEVAA